MMARRLLNAFRKSEEGTATIELAMVATVFALMLVGVVDLTMAFNRKVEMEQALQRSLEKIMNTTTTTTPTQTIKNETVAALPGVPDTNVTVDYMLECDGTVQKQAVSTTVTTEEPDATAECEPDETQRRYITASVTDEFVPVISPRHLGFNKASFTITAKAGVRVE